MKKLIELANLVGNIDPISNKVVPFLNHACNCFKLSSIKESNDISFMLYRVHFSGINDNT
jgi:hypothetical protein